jgi:phospho-N-acetylmuramoyl-pentapeptide-transferase
LWLCAIATALLGYWLVPLLRDLKTGQVIREDGPQAHLKKAGTPTMGGVFFCTCSSASLFSVVWLCY